MGQQAGTEADQAALPWGARRRQQNTKEAPSEMRAVAVANASGAAARAALRPARHGSATTISHRPSPMCALAALLGYQRRGAAPWRSATEESALRGTPRRGRPNALLPMPRAMTPPVVPLRVTGSSNCVGSAERNPTCAPRAPARAPLVRFRAAPHLLLLLLLLLRAAPPMRCLLTAAPLRRGLHDGADGAPRAPRASVWTT